MEFAVTDIRAVAFRRLQIDGSCEFTFHKFENFGIFYFGSWMWGIWENVVCSVSSDASSDSWVKTIFQRYRPLASAPFTSAVCSLLYIPVSYSRGSFAIRRIRQVHIWLRTAGKLQWVIIGDSFTVVTEQIILYWSLLNSFRVLFAAYFVKFKSSSIHILS